VLSESFWDMRVLPPADGRHEEGRFPDVRVTKMTLRRENCQDHLPDADKP
jgi:hypothetical protein